MLLLLALLAAGCGGGASSPRSLAELTNPFLGLEHSAWLAGAIARLASPQEIQDYLALRDDQQAEAFIQAFWDRRDPAPDKPGNPFRETFDQRAADADRLYSEAGFLGRRTDRGIVYVLYGPPEKVDHEVSPVPEGPPIEVWIYSAHAPSGLDGKRPGPRRFIKRGDLTVLYFPGLRPGPLAPQLEPPNP
ncbi:MAG TPA: GWxTD domain-containing protein [Thermoanaerobaculia bacterium]|jgi:GWxTD domain-containing protein|nr:GWxTD domain-containing protein [Thermoanaerobaculia bacterium]